MIPIPRKNVVVGVSLGALAAGVINTITRYRFSHKLTNGDLQAVSDLRYALDQVRSGDDLPDMVKLRNMTHRMEIRGRGSLKRLRQQIAQLSYQELTDRQDIALEAFMAVVCNRADQNEI